MSLRVIDLEKRHPGSAAPALTGLSLDVAKGQVAAVLGRSGSGKTTFLRCVVGLDPFDAGTIEVDGTALRAGAAPARLGGKVGLVFQSFELFPHLSVLDNCTLGPVEVRRHKRADAEKQALALLDQLGLADKARAFPEALSGGQKQRVAIARALAMEPRVLLYDEPTSALDPSLKQEVGKTLRRLAATGITQVMVTHDIAVAREAADLVFVLAGGRVVESGPPGEVLVSPQHEATRALLSGE
ncbi:MAG: amino acid ABC transporter ATP-binding protein [Byssovorax sp.]